MLEQAGCPAHAELIRAVRAGRIALLGMQRDGPFPSRQELRRARRPVLALIGDDDYQASGPGGWRCTARALAWARAVIVHGAAATVETYALAVAAAERTGRALLVETDSAHLAEWVARVPPEVATQVIAPEGGVHPIAPERVNLQ